MKRANQTQVVSDFLLTSALVFLSVLSVLAPGIIAGLVYVYWLRYDGVITLGIVGTFLMAFALPLTLVSKKIDHEHF